MQYSVLKKCLPVIQSFLETFCSSYFTLSLSSIKVFGSRESVRSPCYLDSIAMGTELIYYFDSIYVSLIIGKLSV